jgi:hypothetical protein
MGETLELLWSSLWAANPWPGRVVIVSIVSVVAVAILLGWRQLARYSLEERAIQWVSEFLRSWGGRRAESGGRDRDDADSDPRPESEDDETVDPQVPLEEASDGAEEDGDEAATENPEPSTEEVVEASPRDDPSETREPDRLMTELLGEVCAHHRFGESLIGDRIRAIDEMRRYRVKVDVDTLQDLALYRDAAKTGHGFPSFAAGLSMMLGILGTFLGLAAMVQEIHLGLPSETANLSLDSWMSSVQQLGSVLGGMKTAFSTSLVGMTGAILSSSVAYWIGHRRRQVFELLERMTAAELVPATVSAVENESLLARVSNQLEDSFSRLDEIYRQNQDALKDLTGAQEAFVEIVDEVRDITRGQAARNLDGLLGQLAPASESVLAVSRQIPRVVSTFESTARELRASAEQIHRSAVRSASRPDLVLGLRPVTWLAIIGAAVVLVGLARVLNAL